MNSFALRTAPYVLAVPLLVMSPGDGDSVDFRYAPAHSFSVICLPTDWLKTAVSESGALVYDFGPGPYVKPFTEIALSFAGESLTVRRQFLPEPKVPIIQTDLVFPSGTIRQQSFSLIPERPDYPTGLTQGRRVRRLGGLNGCAGWAPVPAGTDSLFRNVAWGTNRPIRYRVSVEPGGRRTVALGLCESYKSRAGMRILELQVEGARTRRVDPVVGGKNGIPLAEVFRAVDLNHDGEISVEVHAAPGSDPNVILNAFWVFRAGTEVTPREIIEGTASSRAEIAYSCGLESEQSAGKPRFDAMIADIASGSGQPVITIRSARNLRYDTASSSVYSHKTPFLVSRPRPLRASVRDGAMRLELPAGTAHAEILVVHGPDAPPPSFPDVTSEREKVRQYWTHDAPVPRGVLKIPDAGLQYVLDASARTIYQVADIVDGQFQFQPGPSVYRGLWIGDMALIAPQVLMLGDTLSTQRYIEGALRYRQPDGQIRVGEPTEFLPETPMVMNAIWWYARSTGNRQWMEDHWEVMEEGARWLQRMRERTLKDWDAPFRGLMPPGFLDGGLSEAGADYGSVWWAMIGLEKAVQSARWLGKDSVAGEWQMSLNAFNESFQASARKDLRPDDSGIPYLPIIVGDTLSNFPQRGQYAFLLPLRFGDFFDRGSPLIDSVITGTLAMLDARTREGLIVSSGWLTDAVWSWLGGVHSLAHQWFGDPQKAVEILYAFANHATTTGTFLEEQLTRDKGTRTAGDASDAEASSLLIDAVRNLIVRERRGNLELLPGVPEHWIRPGARIELQGGYTLFGPFSLLLQVTPDGKTLVVKGSPLDGRGTAGHVVVRLHALRNAGYRTTRGEVLPDTVEFPWRQPISLQFVKPD